MSTWTSIITIINTVLSPGNNPFIDFKKIDKMLKKANVSAKSQSSQSQKPTVCVGNCPAKLPYFDVDKSVNYLNENAEDDSIGKCAMYVRMALEAGGLNLNDRPPSAKDYNPYLELKGFVKVDKGNYEAEKGDIAVFVAFVRKKDTGEVKIHKYGHIQMYNGEKWVSDFVQREFWAGPDFKSVQPEYEIFRRL